jgi:GT2 family glycosyltransferase
MTGRDSVHEAELTKSLRELAKARRRLEDLREAYTIVEKSRFALLRRAFRSLKGLAGFTHARPPLVVESRYLRESAVPSPNGSDDGLARRLLDAELDRTNLLESIIVERAHMRLEDDYERWLSLSVVRPTDLERLRQMSETLPRRVTISVIMGTFDTPEQFLREAIESVRAQVYPYWELCIADDASTKSHVREILEAYTSLDSRIKVFYRNENGHIARASNSALALASGEFVGFLDHDDTLSPDALFEVVMAINRFPDVDMLYSDEDKIDEAGNFCEPHFKPDWSPDSFLSRMYTCHFGVYRRSLIESLGGFRTEFSGSQDYDLVLRLTERTDKIYHIPRLLYHWRRHSESTAVEGKAKPYAFAAAIQALNEALDRRNEPGIARERADHPGIYVVRYDIHEPRRVSVIIPTRDQSQYLDRCLESLFAKTSYKDLEIIIVDNGSREKATEDVLRRWTRRDTRIRVLPYDVPFNYSKINNYAVAQSTGNYLLLLNNDTEALSDGWIEAMVEQAQRPSIGAVGAILLYPDNTIQHAGVVIGMLGLAGHAHKNFPADHPGYVGLLRAVHNYSAVTGACLMTRRSVFDEVGGLDEKLAIAFNDVDLCLKMCEAGYRNVLLPHVRLYHYESKSRGTEDTPEKLARFKREINLMRLRWRTYIEHDPCYNPNLTLTTEAFGLRTIAEDQFRRSNLELVAL